MFLALIIGAIVNQSQHYEPKYALSYSKSDRLEITLKTGIGPISFDRVDAYINLYYIGIVCTGGQQSFYIYLI